MTQDLTENLRHPDVKVRRGALADLLKSNSQQKKAILRELIELETNARFQFELKRALSELNTFHNPTNGSELIEQIKKQLNSKNTNDLKSAARLISQHNLQQFLPSLMKLKNIDPLFGMTALHLMRKNKVKYFNYVRTFLLDKHSNVVMRALDVLIEYGHTSALTLCLQSLDHSNPKIKNYIRSHLYQLGDKKLKFLFNKLLLRQEERFDLLVFRSAVNLRFSGLNEILKILQTRAKGEFSKQIQEMIRRLNKNLSAPETEKNDIEKRFQEAQSTHELISLIHSLNDEQIVINLKLKILMSFLSHPDSEIKLACLEGLVKLAPENLITLFQQFLNDPNPEIRSTAILALSQHPTLAPIYKDEISLSLKSMIQIGTRESLLTTLTCIGNLLDKDHIPLIYEVLKHASKDAELQDMARSVLEYLSLNAFDDNDLSVSENDSFNHLNENDFITKLEEILVGEDIEYKIQLLNGLTQFEVIRYSESVNELLFRLRKTEDEPKVLALILRNLGLYQHQKSSEFLLEYLDHANVEVKAAALKSLSYYQDSRVLITYMELLNDSWKNTKTLRLMDEIIDYIFLKRPDLAISAIEKLGKMGRTQEERLKDWMSHCNTCSLPVIQVMSNWFHQEFSESFLDYTCNHMCELLSNWDVSKVASILLSNPHDHIRNKFINKFKILEGQSDTKIKSAVSLKTDQVSEKTENLSATVTETKDEIQLSKPIEIETVTDDTNSISNTNEESVDSQESDDTVLSPTELNSEISIKKERIFKFNFLELIKGTIPYVITTASIFLVIINISKFSSNFNKVTLNPNKKMSENPSGLGPGSKINGKAIFLSQTSSNQVLAQFNGYSVIMKLKKPEWTARSSDNTILLKGYVDKYDEVGNLLLVPESI